MAADNISIKERIKDEFVKCATDPVYFMKKYYMIQHPQRGRQYFDLYPFQEKVLTLFQKHNDSIINKSRQLGISTLVSAYALWMMMFQKDKNILVIATKQETAKNMVTKVRFAYNNLPDWMKQLTKSTSNNALSLTLTNGSQIKAVSAAGDAGRSEAVSLLVIDEAAFIDNIETIYTAAKLTLATGGGCIALSTPNGVGNWFHATYSKAQKQENSFLPISLPWSVHPERDIAWRRQQDIDLGVRNAAQECFDADVRIYTNKGLIKISNVVEGDFVLTHKGRYKKVIRTFVKESSDLYKFYTNKNNKKSYVTSNHPILVDENKEIFKEVKNISSEIDLGFTFVKSLDDTENTKKLDLYESVNPKFFKKILVDDKSFYINDRKHKKIHSRYLDFDYDLGKLIGLYAAEGSHCRLRVSYSFNYEKELDTWVKEIQRIITSKFNISNFSISRGKGKAAQLLISSEIFSQFISLFISGNDSKNKYFTNLVFDNYNRNFYRGILDGYLLGDGCFAQKPCYSTVSEELYYNIFYISNFSFKNIVYIFIICLIS